MIKVNCFQKESLVDNNHITEIIYYVLGDISRLNITWIQNPS